MAEHRRLDTDVEDLIATVAARVVAAASESADSDTKLARKRYTRTLVGSILGLLATCSGGAFGFWKLAGPEQATERAEEAADKADEKTNQLEVLQKKLESAEAEREEERRVLVDGRLDRVETKVGSIEGRLAGQDGKLDALLEVQLGARGAEKVKKAAEKTAEKVEAAARGE